MSKKTRKSENVSSSFIEIVERMDDGQLESWRFEVNELDALLDETAEDGGWSPSLNRLQHVLLNAWSAAHEARDSVALVTFRFPERRQ